jgi:hypothetical protein
MCGRIEHGCIDVECSAWLGHACCLSSAMARDYPGGGPVQTCDVASAAS